MPNIAEVALLTQLPQYRESKSSARSRCLELQKKPPTILHRVNSKTGSIINILDVSVQESEYEAMSSGHDSSPFKSKYTFFQLNTS